MPATAGITSFAGGVSTLVLGSVLVGGALIYDAGAVRVYIHEKKPGGDHVRLWIPAAAVPVALKFVPDKKLREAGRDLQPWFPAIEIAAEELARCPDGPLVEVTNPQEKVSIVKHGESLVIDVDSDQETVHISFPVKLVSKVAREFRAAGPPV